MKKSLILTFFVILMGSEISLRGMEEKRRLEKGEESPSKKMRKQDDPTHGNKNFKRIALPGLALSGGITDDDEALELERKCRNVIGLNDKVRQFNKECKEDHFRNRTNS